MRVYELAKKIGKTSKETVELLASVKVVVKAASSNISDADATKLENALKKLTKKVPARKAIPEKVTATVKPISKTKKVPVKREKTVKTIKVKILFTTKEVQLTIAVGSTLEELKQHPDLREVNFNTLKFLNGMTLMHNNDVFTEDVVITTSVIKKNG